MGEQLPEAELGLVWVDGDNFPTVGKTLLVPQQLAFASLTPRSRDSCACHKTPVTRWDYSADQTLRAVRGREKTRPRAVSGRQTPADRWHLWPEPSPRSVLRESGHARPTDFQERLRRALKRRLSGI